LKPKTKQKGDPRGGGPQKLQHREKKSDKKTTRRKGVFCKEMDGLKSFTTGKLVGVGRTGKKRLNILQKERKKITVDQLKKKGNKCVLWGVGGGQWGQKKSVVTLPHP